MGNMFSNTLVEMVNKCKNDSEEDGCDKTMTVDGKKVRISIVDLQDIKDGMEKEVQHLYDSDDIYDEMNYLIKLKKNLMLLIMNWIVIIKKMKSNII